jgi:hypothetical protein
VSIATHISTFTEHDAEKSVTIDPMHTQCTWYELYQIRIKRNKWDELRICSQQQNKLQIYTIVYLHINCWILYLYTNVIKNVNTVRSQHTRVYATIGIKSVLPIKTKFNSTSCWVFFFNHVQIERIVKPNFVLARKPELK